MIVYFLTFGLSLIIYMAFSHGKKHKGYTYKSLTTPKRINRISFAVFLSAIPPIFISASRYNVGTDYFATYYTGFYRILDGSNVDGFEFGYYWLNRVVQLFTDNVFAIFAITSILFGGITFKLIEDSSVDIPLSILMLLFTRYYFIAMNGVRQFIAIAILTYSIKYIIRKEPLKFTFCILCALSFHYMSILFIPVYFIGRLEMPKRRLFTWTIIDVIFFTCGTGIIRYFLQGTKYGELILKFDVAGINFTIFTIGINALLLYIAYSEYPERQADEKYRVYLNIQLFAFWVSLVLRSIPLMERAYWIFSFPIIISFPYFLIGKKKTIRKIYKYGILLVFFIYMVYDIAILGDHSVLPYRWVFGETPVHNSGWMWYR